MVSESLKIISYDPGAMRRRRWMLVALSVILVSGSYFFGRFETLRVHEQLDLELARAKQGWSEVESSLTECQQSLAVATKKSHIDHLATEEVRQQLSMLREQVTRQQEDIAFYLSVMFGQKQQQGLKIAKVQMAPQSTALRYRYQLVLAQVGKKHPWVQGQVNLNLIGTQESEKQILPLSALADLTIASLNFKFRYFQKLEGELQLPAGFKPEYVQITLTADGRAVQAVEDQFRWVDIKGA